MDQDRDLVLGKTTVLMAENGGKYPDGNSLLVQGTEQTVLIDPSVGLVNRQHTLPRIDRVLHSHCHEDHFAGSFLFQEKPWHFHEYDAPSIKSLDALMEFYGYPAHIDKPWRQKVVADFNFTSCLHPVPFRDGDIFELGDCEIRVIHLPGHTPGHSAFHIFPDDVLYLGDIELSSFGPYYGDACSDLITFENSLRLVHDIPAKHYATFHHIGVLDRSNFEKRLRQFVEKIKSRESELLSFLSEPRTVDEVVDHRFVFRPGDELIYIDAVERYSMCQHIDRLVAVGKVCSTQDGRFMKIDPTS